MLGNRIRSLKKLIPSDSTRVYIETRYCIHYGLKKLTELPKRSTEARNLSRTLLEAGRLLIKSKEVLGIKRERAEFPIVIS